MVLCRASRRTQQLSVLCLCIIIRLFLSSFCCFLSSLCSFEMVTKDGSDERHCSRISSATRQFRDSRIIHTCGGLGKAESCIAVVFFLCFGFAESAFVESHRYIIVISWSLCIQVAVQMRMCFDPFSAYNEHAPRRMSNCKTNQQLKAGEKNGQRHRDNSGSSRGSQIELSMKWVSY